MPETSFTKLLRELMGDETQPRFAESIGVSQRIISYLLNGERRPGMKPVRGLVARFPDRRNEILDAAVNCVRMPEAIKEKLTRGKSVLGDIHVIIDPIIHEAALAAKAVTGITLTDVVESALADFALETPIGTHILVLAGKFPSKVSNEREKSGE